MTRRLLVPLDGSQAGEASLPWAVMLARRYDADIALVRAISLSPLVGGGPYGEYMITDTYEQVLADERSVAREYLDTVRDRLTAEGVSVETHVRVGRASMVILDVADELGVEAIVMTTHGRGGWARVVLGSVAEQVLQSATMPMLLVRADDVAPGRQPALDRLLVPLDGSALAERALDFAAELARPGATLRLVCVTAESGHLGARKRAASGDGDAEHDARTYLDRVSQMLTGRGLISHLDNRLGAPAEQILAAAQEHDADLIVMATHGRTGPVRWWLGSVADAVVRRADRPVLLVSARALIARASAPYTIGDVMTREPTVVRDDESLAAVVQKLLRARVSSLPVLDRSGKVVGLVSALDLADWHGRVTAEIARQEAPDPREYGLRLRSATAADIMVRPAAVVDESAPLGQAVRLFRERRIGRLPVTRDGHLVGVVSGTDIVKAMAARYQATNDSENLPD